MTKINQKTKNMTSLRTYDQIDLSPLKQMLANTDEKFNEVKNKFANF